VTLEVIDHIVVQVVSDNARVVSGDIRAVEVDIHLVVASDQDVRTHRIDAPNVLAGETDKLGEDLDLR